VILVEFSHRAEIRMGSPFQTCRIHFSGEWIPELPAYGWVGLFTRSNDFRFLALAKWDTADNEPGFRVVIVDEVTRTVTETHKMPGCCQSLSLKGGSISWKAFPDKQGAVSF
jgi:hypothetical protein